MKYHIFFPPDWSEIRVRSYLCQRFDYLTWFSVRDRMGRLDEHENFAWYAVFR